mmetsp:Transcript_6152/g.18233  ORF Transcript_6152/g.18233 Transcript_6152/m.18233 type:complete len:329 (-) Transcript_6152:14-1000(-)
MQAHVLAQPNLIAMYFPILPLVTLVASPHHRRLVLNGEAKVRVANCGAALCRAEATALDVQPPPLPRVLVVTLRKVHAAAARGCLAAAAPTIAAGAVAGGVDVFQATHRAPAIPLLAPVIVLAHAVTVTRPRLVVLAAIQAEPLCVHEHACVLVILEPLLQNGGPWVATVQRARLARRDLVDVQAQASVLRDVPYGCEASAARHDDHFGLVGVGGEQVQRRAKRIASHRADKARAQERQAQERKRSDARLPQDAATGARTPLASWSRQHVALGRQAQQVLDAVLNGMLGGRGHPLVHRKHARAFHSTPVMAIPCPICQRPAPQWGGGA